jgi:hypothetical protein
MKKTFGENHMNVTDLVKHGDMKFFELKHEPIEIMILKNHEILCSGCGILKLYDQNFNLIKIIDKINGEKFFLSGISMNEEAKKIYISDIFYSDNHKIIMVDLDFNFIKSVGRLNLPSAVCYKNQRLYVADNMNQRIKILSEDLECIQALSLEYYPCNLKASNKILCVTSDYSEHHPTYLFFYDLSNLSLLQKYKHEYDRRISEIDSHFYEFNSKMKKFFCYNQNGELTEEILLKNVSSEFFNDHYDGNLVFFNGSLLMNLFQAKKIIKFSPKIVP